MRSERQSVEGQTSASVIALIGKNQNFGPNLQKEVKMMSWNLGWQELLVKNEGKNSEKQQEDLGYLFIYFIFIF